MVDTHTHYIKRREVCRTLLIFQITRQNACGHRRHPSIQWVESQSDTHKHITSNSPSSFTYTNYTFIQSIPHEFYRTNYRSNKVQKKDQITPAIFFIHFIEFPFSLFDAHLSRIAQIKRIFVTDLLFLPNTSCK